MKVRLEDSWREALAPEFEKLYFALLTDRIRAEYQTGIVYPPAGQIFRALDLCPLPQVRVVLLGQDPYHGAGQAEGLSFSVPDGVPAPPSLRNIKQEITSDLGRPSIIREGKPPPLGTTRRPTPQRYPHRTIGASSLPPRLRLGDVYRRSDHDD